MLELAAVNLSLTESIAQQQCAKDQITLGQVSCAAEPTTGEKLARQVIIPSNLVYCTDQLTGS